LAAVLKESIVPPVAALKTLENMGVPCEPVAPNLSKVGAVPGLNSISWGAALSLMFIPVFILLVVPLVPEVIAGSTVRPPLVVAAAVPGAPPIDPIVLIG
jgi:hypothetical protein